MDNATKDIFQEGGESTEPQLLGDATFETFGVEALDLANIEAPGEVEETPQANIEVDQRRTQQHIVTAPATSGLETLELANTEALGQFKESPQAGIEPDQNPRQQNPANTRQSPISIIATNIDDHLGSLYVPPANPYSTPSICTKYLGPPTIHAREGQRTTDRPRVLIGWYHQVDNAASLLQGRVFAAVTEKRRLALQVFDQVFNRSEDLAIGQHCGVAHFAMVKMFHPAWCIVDDAEGTLRVPVNGVLKDKEHCRHVYLDILRRRGGEVGYHLGEVESASTVIDQDEDDYQEHDQGDAALIDADLDHEQPSNDGDADHNNTYSTVDDQTDTFPLLWSNIGSGYDTTRPVEDYSDLDAGPKRKKKKTAPKSKPMDNLPKKSRGRPPKKAKSPTNSTAQPSRRKQQNKEDAGENMPEPASQNSLFVESDDTDTSICYEADLVGAQGSAIISNGPRFALELPDLGSEDLEHDMEINFINGPLDPSFQEPSSTTSDRFVLLDREGHDSSRGTTPRPTVQIKQEVYNPYERSVSIKSQFLEPSLFDIPVYRGGGTMLDPLELGED